MNFLNPLAWWALAAVVPVIALYLVKSRLRERTVSTLLFWEAVGPRLQTAPLWRKLRRWLSLVLQLLFLGLLIFALLRPSPPWLSKQAEARVIVLDVSPSMGAEGGRWARAVQEAEKQIRALRSFDEAALVAASRPPQLICGWTSNSKRLRSALRLVQPESMEAPPGPALELARNLAASRERGRVVLVSDGVWSAALTEEQRDGVQLVRVDESESKSFDNAGLVRFSVRRSLAAPGDYEVLAEAARSAPENAREKVYELELLRDGRTIDIQAVTLVPGGEWRRSWPGSGEGGAVFEAVLRPAGQANTPEKEQGRSGDSLVADDRARVELPALAPVEVVRAGQPFVYLDAALASLPNVRLVPAAEAGKETGQPRLWFFYGDAPADFREKHPRDAVVVLYPNGSGFWGTAGEAVEQPLVSEWERGHPVMRFLDFEQVRFMRARAMAPPPGTEVLLRSFENPLMYGEWPGWLVLAFDPERSDLVFRTAFPILLGNLVQSLRDDTKARVAELPGKTETRGIVRFPVPGAEEGADSGRLVWLWAWAGVPLWTLALMLGMVWIFAEWRLFHRKVTE